MMKACACVLVASRMKLREKEPQLRLTNPTLFASFVQ